MEKSSQSSFLKSLALALGDGLLFSVAMKLAQGPSKTREDGMTDLGPLAERLRKVEDHTQTIDKDALMKFGEGLDGRVLEKVIVALEARLTEHVGQVDRRLAEIDAQVALDLKAVDTHTTAQTNAVEKAIQQIETQVRDYVAAAQQSSAGQISGVDQKLSALQDALPAKFREIVEAVRQSMEARVALEMTELENRVSSLGVAPEQLQEIQTNLRGEVEALSGKLSADMRELADHQQSQTAPLQQALQQLETKLTTLREELPPKIRQIVEAVEASMDARISTGDQLAAERAAGLEQALATLRAEMPTAGGFQQAVDESLRRHADQVGALDQKLTVLQEELPPKIKAIVDAVRESLDARMAVELQGIEERHGAQLQQLAAESKTPALERSVAQLQADLAATNTRVETGGSRVTDRLASLEQHAAQMTAGLSSELDSMRTQHAAQIESAVAGLRQSMEAKLAAEIHDLEARIPDRSPDLEKALQYASLLEARVQTLERKLQRSAEETVNLAVERVWQALESRLQQRPAPAPPAVVQPVETITGLRQKSTSAEQSVLDLIAGIGQLFEKPASRVVHEAPPPAPPVYVEPEPVAAVHVEPEPVTAVHVEPEPVATVHVEPEPPAPVESEPVGAAHAEPEPVAVTHTPPAPEPAAIAEPEPVAPVVAPEPEPAVAPVAAAVAAPNGVAAATEEIAEPKLEDKPPVILFKPKESGRKWRIPFVSSFLLMAVAIAWLQFM
jgi:predicted  nucleic acid-binding Zn-ribbon protein